MALGASSYAATAVLDAIGNNTSFVVATPYIKLHTGDPGAAGTANAATETTRKLVSFGAAAAGAISNDADITWSGIAGSQDATHFTIWDHITAGNFIMSGAITANAFTAGDTYVIPSGDLDLSIPIAS
jgi:UDP-N-acetylglucosamine enolpyruvyl transferase